MKLLLAVLSVALVGCSGSVNFSVMKQWDRPAERTITEDVVRSTDPKIQIKTQEPVRLESIPEIKEPAPAPTVEPKKMEFEVPTIIVPEKQGVIKAYYIHNHSDDGKACYVRTVEGVYAQNLTNFP